LNYNALIHPEVLTSKPGYLKQSESLDSKVTPEELKLSKGWAGTLIDKIYVRKAREAELNGSNGLDRVRKRKATVEENLWANDKRHGRLTCSSREVPIVKRHLQLCKGEG